MSSPYSQLGDCARLLLTGCPRDEIAELWRYQVGPANSAFPYDYNSWPIHVSRMEQLWRYQVGPSGVKHGVTVGDDYICLRDWKGKFIRGTPEGPYNDRTDCFDDERFIVKFLGDDLVSIQRWEGKYLRCNKPNAGASETVDETAKFILYINENENKLYLYNPHHGEMFGAWYANHLLLCKDPNPYSSETFYGWKEGSKDAWTAKDKWIVVGTFDNRKSMVTATFTYAKTVGLEQTPTIDTCGSVAVTPEAGKCFGKFFSSRVSTTVGVDWSQEPSATWSTPMTIKDSVEVPPGIAISVYQAVGTYGIFTAKTNHLRAENSGCEGNANTQRHVTALS